MPNWLRQGTATTVQFGPFVEATDGYTYKATTITFASGTVIYVYPGDLTTGILVAPSLSRPGWMTVPIAASDVANPGPFMLRCGNVTSNLPVWREFLVVPQQVYDSMVLGTDLLQVDTQQINGGAPTAITLNADAKLINGAAPTTITFNADVKLINGAAPTNITFNANMLLVTGAAPSAALPQMLMDYVMFTPGVQSLTVKDTLKMMAAVLGGKEDGATGANMRFFGVSGEVRVSAQVVSGKRTGVTWVSG